MLQYFKDKKYDYYQLNNVGTVYYIESSNTQLISLLNLKKKKTISKTDKLLFLMDSFVGATDRIDFAKKYNRKAFVNILIDNEKQLLNKDISFCFAPLKYGDFETWISNISSDPSDEILSFISSNKDTFKGYIDEIIDEHSIDLFEPLKPSEAIISTLLSDGTIGSISTKGNILFVVADSGVGKTTYINNLIANSLNKYNAKLDTLGIDIKNSGGILVHFDTEQDKETVKQNAYWKVIKPLGIENKTDIAKHYKPQTLVGLSPEEMLKITERKLDALYKKFGNIDFIVIDGLIDFADDYVSDAKQASIIASKVKLWADLYDAVCIVTMHFNPKRGGEVIEKPAGILGSQFVRKAESFIALIKDPKNNSIKVKFNKLRKSKPIPPLQFQFNKYGVIESVVPERTTEDLVIESAIDTLIRLGEANQTILVSEIADCGIIGKDQIKKEYISIIESNPNIVVTPGKGKSKIYSLKSAEFKKKSQPKLLGV